MYSCIFFMSWLIMYVYRTFITIILCTMQSDFDLDDSKIILLNEQNFNRYTSFLQVLKIPLIAGYILDSAQVQYL